MVIEGDKMRSIYLRCRRILDIILSLCLLILLAPVMLFVAVLVRVGLGRPIFFKHTRQGHKGKFSILKFRTMIVDAERIGGGYFSTELNLVPPVGVFLRKTSMDELPQLFNILKGDMSFVGPRPAVPAQVARYTAEQKRRLEVPQGVTGLAQLKYRNNAPWSLRIQSDIEYVEKVSFLTDLKILLSTPCKVLRGSGVRMDQSMSEVDDLGQPKEQWKTCNE